MEPKTPRPKSFDASEFQEMINTLYENMPELEFERRSQIIVPYVLENLEGFNGVKKGPKFRGTPFDFFGFKGNQPYIIEYKGSLRGFNTPGETQKRRLQECLAELEGLHVALLQVKISKSKPTCQYRIFYDKEMDLLFNGPKAPLEPIFDWLRACMGKS